MSHRRLTIVVVLVGLVFLPAFTAYAQTQWTAPRTSNDQPDLQGIWSHNSATPLERPKELADKAVLSDEELAELNQRIAEIRESEQAGDILGDRLVRQALDADTPRTFDPITGNYNSFWLVERELDHRTSLVVQPADGRVPSLPTTAQNRAQTRRTYRQEHPSDGPEARSSGAVS